MTEFRIADIVSRLDKNKSYRRASSADATYMYILSATQRHGIFEPFEGSARKLNHWLSSVEAGRDLCRDAWDIMAELCGSARSTSSRRPA